MAKETVRAACKQVRPLMSADFCEARRRAIGLYRSWYRYIPYVIPIIELKDIKCTYSTYHRSTNLRHPQFNWTNHKIDDTMIYTNKIKYFDIAKNEEDVHCKIREQFYKNACVTDIRVIDMLVIKGYLELNEVAYQWQQKGHILANWNPTLEPKPCDFLGKFIAGHD